MPDILAFGEMQLVRLPTERNIDEVYRSIPALASLSASALAVGNKLSQDARNALFYNTGIDDGLRALKVALSVERLESVKGAELDLAWLQSAEQRTGKDFQSKGLHEDEWLAPPQP